MVAASRTLILFMLIISVGLILSACVGPSGGYVSAGWGDHQKEEVPGEPDVPKTKGPPAHAPAHGYRAKHAYRYYPNERTYYDTQRQLYFYLEGYGWQVGVTLPSYIQLSNEYVSITLDTDKPYEYYDEHKRKYPPGQMKKGKKKGKKWS